MIKLTHAETKKSFFINQQQILAVMPPLDKDEGMYGALIVMADACNSEFQVKESPGEIDDYITTADSLVSHHTLYTD